MWHGISVSLLVCPTVPAYTVNRFCASGLQTVASVAARVAVGELQVAVAGGVESMTAVPMGGFHLNFTPKLAVDYPRSLYRHGKHGRKCGERL